MDRTGYRHETRSAALTPWNMPSSTPLPFTARNRGVGFILVPLLGLFGITTGCKPSRESAQKPAVQIAPDLVSQLAGARIDAAKTKLEQRRPDHALALLVSALRADPASGEARALVEKILRETVWNLPTLTLAHPLPIDQIASSGPSALWVSLGGKCNTTVRWNLETLQIENVLFPAADCATRSLTFDPGHQSVVVERGPVTLLCNAQTLKPIRDLGVLPDFLTSSAVIAFSSDGLLMAHPNYVSEKDHSIVWQLRDTASGQIIRSSEPLATSAPQPLAAYLDRSRLRVLHADGSLLEMPVSPVEPITRTPLLDPAKLLEAQFSRDGNSALTLQGQGPHQSAAQSIISYSENDDGSLEAKALAVRFPWSLQPSLWTGLMGDRESAPFAVHETIVTILTGQHAPIELKSAVTAACFDDHRVITGEMSGTVTVHRLLPLPGERNADHKPLALDQRHLANLEMLAEALAGGRYIESERAFTHSGPADRVKAFNNCRLDAILAIFPELDFSALSGEFKAIGFRAAAPGAFQLMRERLAIADPDGKAWAGRAALEEIFNSSNSNAVLASIQSAGGKGPAAATALALALKSDQPEWIEACLSTAVDLPPMLNQISRSRIAWLQGRKADALSSWPEFLPELPAIRLREDWQGWEQADFTPALENLRQCIRGELAAIEVPEVSTAEQRKAIIARFTDPATIAAVGRARFAQACLKAALAFSAHKEETETTFQLANLARNLGAPPEPCLRAEALALTALGDYQKAHPRWIELITEHPVATHLPGDYAEAAYTAFENSDPQQAMEILTTGMHRYPQDGNFALRAGWVALLTGNSERAYRFLREGQRIGFPDDRLENATALLTIAAAQTGATDDAAVYFQDLLKIDPAWADAQTLDTLDWPEELKASLRQLMQ